MVVTLPPGFSGAVRVSRGPEVVVDATAGMADAERGEPCTGATRFQVASVSKQFTAAVVLLLAEAGRLDPHEPAARWLEAPAPGWQRVTLHHLLSHTAGVPHWQEAPGLEPLAGLATEEIVGAVLAAPLRSEPGSDWHYSSPGFVLAAAIVEAATGRDYPGLVTELILARLNLAATTAGRTPAGGARGHRDARPVPGPDLGGLAGTGDVWSTAADLARYTSALHAGGLVGLPALEAMVRPHGRVDGAGRGPLVATGYGYGLFSGTLCGRRVLYHPGDVPGYRSVTAWLPDEDVCAVVLANEETVDPPGMLADLVQPVLGA